jgi:hypothetical protein
MISLDLEYAFPEPPTELDDDFKNNGGNNSGGNSQKDDINFEDLAERFKRLTKK